MENPRALNGAATNLEAGSDHYPDEALIITQENVTRTARWCTGTVTGTIFGTTARITIPNINLIQTLGSTGRIINLEIHLTENLTSAQSLLAVNGSGIVRKVGVTGANPFVRIGTSNSADRAGAFFTQTTGELLMEDCYNTINIGNASNMNGWLAHVGAGENSAKVTLRRCYNVGEVYQRGKPNEAASDFVSHRYGTTTLKFEDCYTVNDLSLSPGNSSGTGSSSGSLSNVTIY
jgi:hypothetical protein